MDLEARGKRKPGQSGPRSVHTLYISPLKALAVDIARNLEAPVTEMGLDIRLESRTGDTPTHKRQRQKTNPPDILLTTPEQIALLLSDPNAQELFAGLKTIILDELHALVTSKRGDLLALGLARLRRLAPDMKAIGLSATVANPEELRAYLVDQPDPTETAQAGLVEIAGGAEPDITILHSRERIPWSGHSARYALPDMYELIKAHRVTPALRQHALPSGGGVPGSLADQRGHATDCPASRLPRRRPAPQGGGRHGVRGVARRRRDLRRSTWGSTGATSIWSSTLARPRGPVAWPSASAAPTTAWTSPPRPCLCRPTASRCWNARPPCRRPVPGIRTRRPCERARWMFWPSIFWALPAVPPLDPDATYLEIRSSQTYRHLTRARFDRVLEFVATGGYALRSYDRYAKLRKGPDGLYRIANPKIAQQYRLNVGTIVEAPMLKVRLVRSRSAGRRTPLGRGGRMLGEIEEWFIEQLNPGDTFIFGGEVVRFEALIENEAYVSRTTADTPMIPSYMGGKFPLSTYLAATVRHMLATQSLWPQLPDQVRDWLELQALKSRLPEEDGLLVETFPRAGKHYMVCYPFEGRLAHQTLGMLLTKRLERLGARPLGFVANDYALAVWGLGDLSLDFSINRISLNSLFEEDILGDDLDAWLAESSLVKRTFRNCAVISGLIERRHPGQEKNGRQVTVSSDLIYDVLRAHEPDHILLEATWEDAAEGLLDISRLSQLLARITGRITHTPLERVSPSCGSDPP